MTKTTNNIRVLMKPHIDRLTNLSSGIHQVIHYYYKYLPQFGITLVDSDDPNYDLLAGHVGEGATPGIPYVAHVHGLHWTADYTCARWQYSVNSKVIQAVRHAQAVTVPSDWVAETFARDMRFKPHIVPHGIEWQEWQGQPTGDYVLWNKNRNLDVCDPTPMAELAQRFSSGRFITTFAPANYPITNNVQEIGLIPHNQMKQLVQNALVYLSTTKETFGIGVLEAMASGVPVLGYDHGGNRELVQHGVNGYLAQPGNLDDLAEGLTYCLRYHDTLADNGREIAKSYTWEAACQQVADIYRLAYNSFNQPPDVEVVIPVYNKPRHEVERALASACTQTHTPTAIRVVDDGSTDDIGEQVRQLVAEYTDKHPSITIEYIHQSNAGVANARNHGADAGDSKYICCLDSDDWLGPRMLEACVADLEQHKDLGIVYSALHYHKPDGSTGISKWPSNWNFDAHIKKQNQVPTCCVFRREMYDRLGGYRQRYAPTGCGAEDAEFWLRSGAYGYRAQMASAVQPVIERYHEVSDTWKRSADRAAVINRGISAPDYDYAMDALFHYSWQSGYVSGNPNYKEVNWLYWHPWAHDSLHPFASYATPINDAPAHQVRQYDEPILSIVIPVGPSHRFTLFNALDSLEAQTFRRWEAIIANDSGEDLDLSSYPYVRVINTKGGKGAGHARNLGVSIARAPLLFYLDADDYLKPACLQAMLDAWNRTGCIPYSDYEGHAIGVSQSLVDTFQSENRLLYYDGDYAAWTGRSADFDCQRALSQPEDPPWIWSLISSLIPKAWHDEIGGFDEEVPSWEDWDYWVRLAMSGKGFIRIPEPLVVYHYHTGTRREVGREIGAQLITYFNAKYEEIDIMAGCGGGCGQPTPVYNSRAVTSSRRKETAVVDEDFIKCRYTHPNTGEHPFIGPAVFEAPLKLPDVKMRLKMARNSNGTYSIDYGMVCGSDILLAHVLDERASAYLQAVESPASMIRTPEVQRRTEAPVSLREPDLQPHSVPVSDIIAGVAATPPPPPPPPPPSDDPPVIDEKLKSEIERMLSPGGGGMQQDTTLASAIASRPVDSKYVPPPNKSTPLDRIDEIAYTSDDIGVLPIPPKVLKEMQAAGYNTIESVSHFTETDWASYKGIAEARANAITVAIRKLIAK